MAATRASTSARSPVSCAAQELLDGGYALVTVGTRRVRVTRWLPDDPFPQAEVVDLADPPAGDDVSPRARAVAAFGEVYALYGRADPRFSEVPAIGEGAEQASFEIAAMAPIGPLDAQRVLETDRAGDRLLLLAELLEEHARVLRAGDFLE